MVNSRMISMSVADLETRFEGHDRCMGDSLILNEKKDPVGARDFGLVEAMDNGKKGGIDITKGTIMSQMSSCSNFNTF